MERELEASLRKGIYDEKPSDDLEEKLFKLSNQAYQSSTAFLGEFRDKWTRRYNMYNGKHHTGEKYLDKKYGKSKYYVPKTHEFVKNYLSQVDQAYFQNPDFLSLDPANIHNVINVMSAEYYTAVMNYRLQQRNHWWMKFVHISSTSQIMHNMAIAKVDWSTTYKSPTATPILIERFRLDPHADPLDPIGSSPYLINITEMYISEIKKKAEKSNKYPWLELSNDELNKSLVSSFEQDTNVDRHKDGIDPAKSYSSISNELSKVFVHENIFLIDDQDYVFYTLGTHQMLSPVYKIEEVYPQGRPYVMGSIFPEENKIYSDSLLDHAYEPQRQINDFTNIVADAAKGVVWPKTLIKASSGLNAADYTNAGAGTTFLSRNPQTDVFQITSQNQPQSLKDEIPFLLNQFDAILGGTSTSSNSVSQGQSTATGQNMAVQTQNQVTEMYVRMNHESFILPVIKMLLKCEQIYGLSDSKFINQIFDKHHLVEKYTDELVAQGFDPRTQEFQIDKQFVEAELELYVNIGMGAVSPQQRFERLIAGMAQIRQAFPNIDQQMNTEEWIKEIMSLQGYKNPSRFFKTAPNPQLDAANQTIQQLQEELKLAKKKTDAEIAVEIKHKEAEIRKIDAEIGNIGELSKLNKNKAVKEAVQAQFGAMETGEIIVSIPEVTQAGDQVLHNAGYEHASDTTLGGFTQSTDDQGFYNGLNIPQEAPQSIQPNVQFNNAVPSLQTGNAAPEDNPLDKTNNNPMYPAKPDSAFKGFNSGISTGNK